MSNVSIEYLNVIFEAMRHAENYVQKHTGLLVKCKLDIIDTKGHPKEMMGLIAETLGLGIEQFYVKTRKREIVEMRMLAAFFVKKHYAQLTLMDIAGLFGDNNIDHSTVIHYVNTVNDLVTGPDKPFLWKYRKVLNAINLWIRD
jgi:chromosomal replication initiation ATPase DnaA